MKNFYSILIILAITTSVSAQMQNVYISWEQDYSQPYNGDEVTLSGSSSTIYTSFYVKNLGPNASFIWRRDILSVSSQGFSDQLCDDQICYNTSGNPWICPGPMMIAQNDSSLFQPKLLTGGNSGTAHMRYYVLDENENKLDSIDVIFSSTASIEEETKLNAFSFFPNPAQENVTFKGDMTAYKKVIITDALGKEVLAANINNTQNNLNIAHLKNGVYLVRFESKSGTLTNAKKLIIRR
ncbi:MAG: T9SS type A sorting domain-containing protein [Brumimicrobium sp.]|nr:T9SS type A sorting domain-containing protein [Brumimicrobium sp.]